jgi:coproporphyrinogen III oxidase-like Fe-S oxidoreductase
MTGLRTKWGVDLDELSALSPLGEEFKEYIQKGIDRGEIIQVRNHILLTKDGRIIADKIASDLFLI